MAKTNITHSCGHVVEHDLLGPEAGRVSKAAWLAGRACRACWEAGQAAAVATQAAERNLPELTGTPRQVEWGTKRRAELIKILDQDEAKLLERARTDEVRELVISRAAKMRMVSTAKYWLDRADAGDMRGRLERLVTEHLAKAAGAAS